MPRLAPHVPADEDLLCEACGYTLNGLPHDSRCPECGRLIAESLPETRRPADCETGGSFFRTSAAVLFTHTRFFRSLAARHTSPAERNFARLHTIAASVLMGCAVAAHLGWFWYAGFNPVAIFLLALVSASFVFILFLLLTNLTARLSAWEAAYRGHRLPFNVARRGMRFHAAHYIPVALVFFATTSIHSYLACWEMIGYRGSSIYLYTLCVEVVLSAGYLFWTYWLAMRNLLFANG